MPSLDVTGVIAVKFAATTTQTLNAKTFAHQAGDVIYIDKDITSLTIDLATTNVACMFDLTRDRLDRDQTVIQGFTVDEIRTSSA